MGAGYAAAAKDTFKAVDITDFLCGFMLIIIRNFIQLIKIYSFNVASRV